jgi:hypothetical protein
MMTPNEPNPASDPRHEARLRKLNDPAQWTRPAEELARLGLTFPPAAKLDDEKLSETLWTLIVGLADLRIFLIHTDHLSDRDLYKKLLKELLPHPLPLFLDEDKTDCEYDVIGAPVKEDERIWLRHYATGLDRHIWKRDHPKGRLPAASAPPFDRDRILPRCKKAPLLGDDAPF